MEGAHLCLDILSCTARDRGRRADDGRGRTTVSLRRSRALSRSAVRSGTGGGGGEVDGRGRAIHIPASAAAPPIRTTDAQPDEEGRGGERWKGANSEPVSALSLTTTILLNCVRPLARVTSTVLSGEERSGTGVMYGELAWRISQTAELESDQPRSRIAATGRRDHPRSNNEHF